MFENHSHDNCQKMAMRLANEKCRNNGVRLTPLRRQVLSIILESHIALTAMEILEKSGKDHPPTIYRTLDFFIDLGIIHHIKCNNSYIACLHCDYQERPILLICSECKNVKERPIKKADEALSKEVMQWIDDDFQLTNRVIELVGICRSCRGQ